ncbi:MFS transporter [Massilia antarctica]|uniref:MFS transporter n=1 Tax=Massilia antarctica TaxID=2765360 RepID=UPI0006BB59E2|nr:MFS transporter [Massilia sp. H27-R4]MCY0910260.1 MFS transporter [Massilia sp. H27-R4]CUI09395.1 Nucleoside:H+ symporter:Major facilitator superfamily [Janthinobacterium sp. CG23_2]CUU33181.1 Nucleoside:H+ symporter:Major facilitator superfamily [Janthinobacterium sp. CG23_2]
MPQPAPHVAPKLAPFSLFLFAYYAQVGAFAIYATLFFAARGMSAPQIGVLMSLIQVMRIIGPNLWGWLADHSGQRVRVLRLTSAGALLAFSGMFFAQTYFQFIAVMVVFNLFSSAQAPLAEALLLSALRGDTSNYGRVRMWGSVGFIVAVLAAGWLLDWLGVNALPSIAMFLLVCVGGSGLLIVQAPALPHAEAAPGLWSVLRRREVIAFFVSAALMAGVHMSLNAFYSLYLEQAGYSKPVIGAMWALGVVAEVVFFYFQAPLLRRFGAQRVMMCAFAVAAVRFPLIGAAGQLLVVLALAQLLHAVTFAAHLSSSVMVMQRWFAGPLQARGQALYMSLAYGIGGTAGGLAMSLCWDRIGPPAVFYLAGALALAAAVSAALSFRWQRAQVVA